MANLEEELSDKQGYLKYGLFFELILRQTAKALEYLDKNGRLSKDTKIGIHNKDFVPCSRCLNVRDLCDDCKLEPLKAKPDCQECQKITDCLYRPFTHCADCIPVVTHTKQGICILVKKGDKILLTDLIPLLPPPPDMSIMQLYNMTITSLLEEKPRGWGKAFMAYFTKDKCIPQEMEDLSEKNYDSKAGIGVKLLNYGPENNHAIRPGQSIGAVQKFTSNEGDRVAFQSLKVVLKLLGIEGIGSYVIKKSFLAGTNVERDWAEESIKTNHVREREGLWSLLHSPEIRPSIEGRVVLELEAHGKLLKEGIIQLKS